MPGSAPFVAELSVTQFALFANGSRMVGSQQIAPALSLTFTIGLVRVSGRGRRDEEL